MLSQKTGRSDRDSVEEMDAESAFDDLEENEYPF